MKKIEIIKEANIGSNIELTNIELVLIKSKWNKIKSKFKNQDKEILEFSEFMNKLCHNVLSFDEVSNELFSSESFTEESLKEIVNVSVYNTYDSDEDEERSQRRIDRTTNV